MEVTKVHDISVLHFFGEVSFMEIDHIEKTLASLKKTKNNKVLIDLTSVDHIHYVVIKRLVDNVERFRKEKGDIKLVNLNPDTRDLFRFTGADQHLEDYASISEAILSFLCNLDYNNDVVFQ
jgi:anti-anti-sigma factor